MASKFQNRLVGTVILVALGVIILPGLLDGKKKHYEDEFASIPLVPKAGDVEEQDSVPPVTQSLPAQAPALRNRFRGTYDKAKVATHAALSVQYRQAVPIQLQRLMPRIVAGNAAAPATHTAVPVEPRIADGIPVQFLS